MTANRATDCNQENIFFAPSGGICVTNWNYWHINKFHSKNFTNIFICISMVNIWARYRHLLQAIGICITIPCFPFFICLQQIDKSTDCTSAGAINHNNWQLSKFMELLFDSAFGRALNSLNERHKRGQLVNFVRSYFWIC